MSTHNRAIDRQPRTFDSLKGQDSVVQKILEDLQHGLAPAYLATGPSGTGKTSVAILLAAFLLCTDRQTFDPCWACDSCLTILSRTNPNMKFVPGASERSIAIVKNELLPFIMATPWGATNRILIIDEFQAYKQDAWEAFLTPLETLPQQAPDSVIIFCSTARHKLPITIRNRCVPLNFVPLAEEHLVEAILIDYPDIDDDTLTALLEEADGSMRTLYMILDGFDGNELTEAALRAQAGKLTRAELQALFTAVHKKDYDRIQILWNIYSSRKLDLLQVSEQILKIVCQQMAANPEWSGWTPALQAMGWASVYNQKSHWLAALYKLAGFPAKGPA